MRLQLALNVENLDQSIAYYSKMFGEARHKTGKGYANSAIDNPALKLVLFENPQASERLNHLGVEMFDAADIEKTARRFEDAGILKSVQTASVCFHADQDKVWTEELQGLSWEWYVINDDSPDLAANHDASRCCSGLNECR